MRHVMPTASLPTASLIAVTMLLGGCGDSKKVDVKNESPATVAEKVASSGMTPRPGRWQGTLRMEKMEMPGMPPQAQQALDTAMGQEKTYFTCLTPEQAAKPDARFFQKAAEGCTYEKFTMADGKIDAVMNCQPGKGPTRMAMNGTYGADLYDLKINGSGEMAKGMTMNITMAVTSRRVGECNGTEE
jgi:hypothetical protein